MSNAQRRAAQRHRNKTYPGPMTPADHALHAERQRRIRQLFALRNAALAGYEPPADPPAIPTSGAARRRAKKARRAE